MHEAWSTNYLYFNKYIICVTETWLTPFITDQEILYTGYHIYINDSGSRGGGVMIGISQNILSRKAEIPTYKEVCLVELATCCVYVPPSPSCGNRLRRILRPLPLTFDAVEDFWSSLFQVLKKNSGTHHGCTSDKASYKVYQNSKTSCKI